MYTRVSVEKSTPRVYRSCRVLRECSQGVGVVEWQGLGWYGVGEGFGVV